jgi:hypothetical protein
MNKFCVFCGKNPISKTKEHVIPLWLIKLTGDPQRPLFLQLRSNPDNPIKSIAFDSFTFPSCNDCNQEFAHLESQTQLIVGKMLKRNALSDVELSVFLDWLDKVRTGLWLGFLCWEKNRFKIQPHFHIANRIAAKDRMTVIYRADDEGTGINFIGTNIPMFHHFPTCFTLAINNLYLLNISTDCLFSRRLGFPFPQSISQQEDGQPIMNMVPGRERLMLPLLKIPYFLKGTEIFQPIFHHKLSYNPSPQLAGLYDTSYVREFSLDYERGIGRPLIQKGRSLRKYPSHPSMDWFPIHAAKRQALHKICIEQTLRIQSKLFQQTPIPNDVLQRKKYIVLKNHNLRMLKNLDASLKEMRDLIENYDE